MVFEGDMSYSCTIKPETVHLNEEHIHKEFGGVPGGTSVAFLYEPTLLFFRVLITALTIQEQSVIIRYLLSLTDFKIVPNNMDSILSYDIEVLTESLKMELDPISVSYVNNIFDMLDKPIYSSQPLSFEELQLRHGFVYYSTNISFHASDPSLLHVENGVFDRGMVFVNKLFKGLLSRIRSIKQIPLSLEKGEQLGILVENQGHACCSNIPERKGILGEVRLGSKTLSGWNMFRLFTDWNKAIEQVQNHIYKSPDIDKVDGGVKPSFYCATFVLPNDTTLPLDTFFRLENGRKGIAFLNGFNLGRYWPVMGPQITLYAPKSLFKPFPNKNFITVLELERPVNKTLTVKFTRKHVINGKTLDNL